MKNLKLYVLIFFTVQVFRSSAQTDTTHIINNDMDHVLDSNATNSHIENGGAIIQTDDTRHTMGASTIDSMPVKNVNTTPKPARENKPTEPKKLAKPAKVEVLQPVKPAKPVHTAVAPVKVKKTEVVKKAATDPQPTQKTMYLLKDSAVRHDPKLKKK